MTMELPGFTAEASLYQRRGALSFYRRQSVRAASFAGRITPQQSTCEEFICADGRPSTGEYPYCACEALPPEPPSGPTCEGEPICPPGLVGYGSWPDCGCKHPDDPDPPPGGGGGSSGSDGGGFSPGLGGAQTCSDSYMCPPTMQMAEENGACVCKY